MPGRRENLLHLRFFISSPGDLPDERNLAQTIIEQNLQKDDFVRDKVTCEAVRWDDRNAPVAMPATLTPQEAVNRHLPKPSQCQVVIVMLWSRLGTPLPDTYKRRDGSRYLSGTEWEYEDATSARPQPHILIYRCKRNFPYDRANPAEQNRQFKRVEEFFEQFRSSDGSLRGGFVEYETPEEFSERLLKDLKAFIKSLLDSKKVTNRSAARRPSRLRSTLESRNLGAGQPKREPLVTVPRARLDDLKDFQRKLDTYINGYVTCRELSDLCTTIASGLEDARKPNRLGDAYFWKGLCEQLSKAREKIESLPETFKDECSQDIQTFEERLSSAEDQIGSARDSDQESAYRRAVDSSVIVLNQMKHQIVLTVVRAKKETDKLLKEIENVIQRILEWVPQVTEATQDQSRQQTDRYAPTLGRQSESVDHPGANLARAPNRT